MRSSASLLPCLIAAAGAAAQASPDDAALLAARYARVEAELRGADCSALTPAQRRARAQVVEWLREYRERGEFGHGPDWSEQRLPLFIDAEGRRCAVAAL